MSGPSGAPPLPRPYAGPEGWDIRDAPGGRRRLAAGGRRPRPAKPKPGPKAPALWALCAPAAPPQGRSGSHSPGGSAAPLRQRLVARAPASPKGPGARMGCTAPPSPLRWTRGLGYPGRPGGAAAFGGRGPKAPACQTKAGAKGPGFVGALRPRRPPAGPQRFPKKAGQRQTVPAGENLPFSR